MAACVAGAQGDPQRAARLIGAGAALLDASGAVLAATDRIDVQHFRDAVRAELGDAAFEQASTSGQQMPPEQAVAYAREGLPVPEGPQAPVTPQDQ